MINAGFCESRFVPFYFYYKQFIVFAIRQSRRVFVFANKHADNIIYRV